jgi:hypothetical protein
LVYGGPRDAPIWLGTYLAAESYRYAITGSCEAAEQMERSIRTLDLWWRITGDTGYLARFVAPVGCSQPIQNIFQPSTDAENHQNFLFEGTLWNWKGDISRDQYQGTLLGFSVAYEMTRDENLKEIIRSNVVSFVEQLMKKRTKTVHFVVNGIPLTKDIELQYTVYTTHETQSGEPTVTLSISPFTQDDEGMVTFWPNPSVYIRQLPTFSWVPDIKMSSQAIQLAGAFRVALQVTENVPAYAARRQAILDHYEANFIDWYHMAETWSNTSSCGESYFGLNIVFMPMFNWVRLEDNPTRKSYLKTDILRDRFWSAVQNHKNVFFAYLFASQANPADTANVLTVHNAQLSQFPPPPYTAIPVDNTGLYAENPSCPGLSSVAIDVQHRIPAGFIWERNPWTLTDPGADYLVFPGIDYLISYWMGRYFGFLRDDAPNTCLKWKP